MMCSYHKNGHACIHEPLLGVKVEQVGPDDFTVTYGKNVKKGLNYAQAAREFGECTFHALACAGKLDNSEPPSRKQHVGTI